MDLKANGIGASVYYPVVIPLSKFYKARASQGLQKVKGDFPHAMKISSFSIALPVGPHLEVTDIDRVCETLQRVVRGSKSL